MADQEMDEQAMAEMMGFSAFGAQDRPQKKRKYNPAADASVNARKPAGTGSNMTPLAARSVKPPQPAANADEIDLGDDDDADDNEDGGASTAPNASTMGSLPHGLPQRPAPAPGTGPPGPHSEGTHQGHGQDQKHGQQQHCWWEGYYDTLSNRNPWEKLEKSLGLQPRGTWLSHEEQPAVSAT